MALLAGRGVFVGAGGQSYSSVVLGDSPIAYWRLGEASGTTMNDEQATFNGTYNNSPTLGATGAIVGDTDTCVSFNGGTDHARATVTTDLSQFTIECWAKFDDNTQDTVLSYWNSATSNNRISLVNDNGNNLGIWDNNNSWLYSGINPDTTSWYHIVITYDLPGTTRKIYVNGVLKNTDGALTTPPTGKDVIIIGSEDSSHAEPLLGDVDEVSLYNYVLDATQISKHYLAGL